MNGRLYDPVLHRFLQPDNYVQDPMNSQNYNRYGYCWNNPLRFSDPSGEFIHIIVGAVIGGVINLAVKAAQGKINSWQDGFVAFGVGAVAGGLGAATGGAAFAAAGGAAGGAGGFLAGAAGGMVGSAVSTPIQNIGNHLYFGDPLMSGQEYVTGILIGGAIGGTVNGAIAGFKGNNFWTGKSIANGRSIFSFNNTPKVKPESISNSSPSTSNGLANLEGNSHAKGIDYGQQSKHILPQDRIGPKYLYKGAQYQEGRSVLSADPEQILKDLHSLNYDFVKQTYSGPVIKLPYNIGYDLNPTTNILTLTDMVKIHANKDGLVHFVPFILK